jgi:hypothetical protein
MRRLSRAGFKKEFVHAAILPEWWDDTCAEQPNLLPDVEFRVARFLGIPLAAVRDRGADLDFPQYPKAQLRRVRDIDRDRLAPAIHAALRIGSAVVRSLRDPSPPPRKIPPIALTWRNQLRPQAGPVTLDQVLQDLWGRGVPVVPVDVLPSPSFQGISCIVEGRPVILLAHHDEPGRVAFHVAHEAGHIASNDCAPEQPVVDEKDEVVDDTDIEQKADRYATLALVGSEEVPKVDETANFKELARQAGKKERETGVDASLIIFAWAARTRDYTKATQAVQALYLAGGARRQLRQHFDQHVDLDAANESDRALLRCVYGDPERDETPL